MPPPPDDTLSRPDEPITLLWRRATMECVPESFFIERELLVGVGRPLRVVAVDRILDAPFDDRVIVASLGTEFAPYLGERRRRGLRAPVLVHLGDEQGQHDRGFYADAGLVLRNYWFEEIAREPGVHWIPNGYAVGVGPAAVLVPAGARRIEGFYAGALGMRVLSEERHAMRRAVEEAGLPFRLHVTATSRDRLGPAVYAAMLGDARFALVPGGNSPETIRLYDALEMGAVPIMLRSAFVGAPDALGDPPIVLLDRWDELPRVYEAVRGDAGALQQRAVDWWRGFKRAQRSRVAALVGSVFDG